LDGGRPHMNWIQAVLVCVILAVIITVMFVGALWGMHTEELLGLLSSLKRRFSRHGAAPAEIPAAGNESKEPPVPSAEHPDAPASDGDEHTVAAAAVSTTPVSRMTTTAPRSRDVLDMERRNI